MSRHAASDVTHPVLEVSVAPDPERILSHLKQASLPFSAYDITAGSENELQAAVVGHSNDVDLPIAIRSSNFFKNILKRAEAGEHSTRLLTELEEYISPDQVRTWENSWVRVNMAMLGRSARALVSQDLRADKRDPGQGPRQDATRFLTIIDGQEYLRIPISYLLKLALAQATDQEAGCHSYTSRIARRLMDHFLNDNSSPETVSFYVVSLSPSRGMGREAAKEMAQRFLLAQLLMMYANERLGLRASGQRALVYLAPHPPVRQKLLNRLVPDSFYRELFMNPCLSGWDRGEDKYRYMQLCHEVLSRSQLNAVIKLKDAGIITRNLIVLPSLSNISLANNGTHVSLGSRLLTDMVREGTHYGDYHEKYVGDLVIKIVEHFLPLFVGTYSAAPYRLDFSDFHPERALGFLPHELESTHVRMLWRRWKKKARLTVFGQPVTPLGPLWLDKMFSTVLCLKGDCVTDFRIIDYLVALLSTSESPALDGTIGNDGRLKRDLTQLGIFNDAMSVYLLYKLRTFRAMGFSGFEGRHYSLFEAFDQDMGDGITLQALVTALAFKYVMTGAVRHYDIPDGPEVESERRQLTFGTAIDIATCNVRHDTPNRFLHRILLRTRKTRNSRRYPGYLRVRLQDYRLALVQTIEEDGRDLIEQFGAGGIMTNLKERLLHPDQYAVGHRLIHGILSESGARSPLHLPADEFNSIAEGYYRETLRVRQLAEALDTLMDDLAPMERHSGRGDEFALAMRAAVGSGGGASFLRDARSRILTETADAETLRRCIHVTLLAISSNAARVAGSVSENNVCST